MKRAMILSLILAVFISLTGCDLIGSLLGGEKYSDEIYFWSVFEDDGPHTDVPVTRALADPIKVIMTRGRTEETGGYDTEAEATGHLGETEFTVTSDGNVINGGSKEVVQLGDGEWHIKQVFELTGLQKGAIYTITGSTTISGVKIYDDLPWQFKLTID